MKLRRNSRLVAVALLALLAVMVGTASAETRRKHRVAVVENETSPEVEQAEQHMRKGEWAEAATLLEKATAGNPKDYLAWFDLGYVYSEQGKNAESIAAYRKSVEAKPDIFESNLNLGLALAQSGDPEAEKYLSAATQLTPASNPVEGQYRAWLSLGHLLEEKHPSNALAAFQQASRVKQKEAEPHYAAGFILQNSSDWVGAEREFQAALALDPKSEPAIHGLTSVYLQTKRLSEAESMLRKILEADPDNTRARTQLARVLTAQNKHTEASKEFNEGLKAAPDNADLQREAAAVNAQAGDLAAAETKYRQLVSASPKDPELRHALARVLKRQHKYQEAIEQFRICIELNPSAGDAYVDLAFTAASAKNYPLSQAVLEARAKQFPESAPLYFLRATNLDHLRSYSEAIVYYKKFLAEANGKYPDQEWEARHRLITLEKGADLLPESRGVGR